MKNPILPKLCYWSLRLSLFVMDYENNVIELNSSLICHNCKDDKNTFTFHKAF